MSLVLETDFVMPVVIRERTVSRISFMRVKRMWTAFLASVPFVEICMCGTHCFLKSFDIY